MLMREATPSLENEKKPKHFQAYRAVKALIAEHKLIPGQKLILRDMEEMLGMSKTPIINGLMMLEQEGIVVSKTNRGFFMKEVTAEEAEHIYDLREKLESISIDYAIANYEDSDLVRLKQKLELYSGYFSPVYDRKRLQYDTDFHMQIAEMGRNQFFIPLIKQFYENIYFSLNVAFLTANIDEFKLDHAMVVEAIKKKELKRAKEILKKHTRAARKLLVDALR